MATAPNVPILPKYPRLVNIDGYGQTSPVNTTAATFSRYGLVLMTGTFQNPTALKAINPNALVLVYVSTTSISIGSSGVDTGTPNYGMTIWPGWWGTQSGVYLAGAITSGQTTGVVVTGTPTGGWPATHFPALISTPGHATDEVVVVTNVSGTTLTIARNAWQSTGQAQLAGSRIAPLPYISGSYTNEYYGNISPYCPRQPGTNLRWIDYLAQFIATLICTTYPLIDGVFLDNANASALAFPNANLDADLNNASDGMEGPSGFGVQVGLQLLIAAIRAQVAALGASKLILTNGNLWLGQADGGFFEDYQATFGATPPPWNQEQWYDNIAPATLDTNLYPISVVNPTVFTGAGTAISGANNVAYSYNFQFMRFHLCQALMSGAFYQYDWCPLSHGQTWSFDELDQAAGSALSAAITSGTTNLPVVSSAPFHNGQVVRIPYSVVTTNYPTSYTTNTEDELATITNIPDGTHITVTRGTPAGACIQYSKVLPDYGSGLAPWYGWMGAAMGPAVRATANWGSNLLSALNYDFETTTVVTSMATALATGTFPPTNTFANWTLSVTQSGSPVHPVGFLTADTNTFVTGTKSARIVITTIDASSFNFKLVSTGVTVAANTPYTVSWWAKGDRQQQYQVRIRNTGTNVALLQESLNNQWTQYFLTFYQGGSGDTNTTINFEVAAALGTYWFDNVQFQQGDANLFTRDFEHAFVILNATNASVSVALPAITSPTGSTYTTYKKLAGSQDATTNDGSSHAPTTTVTVPALDGLVLVKA